MSANEQLNKTRVLRKDLPDATIDGKYVLRYRIVSEDGTKTSQWSPLHTITAKTTTELIGTNDVTAVYYSDGTAVRLNWDVPEGLGVDRFDVYIAWSATTPATNTPEFFSTVSGNSVYAVIPAGMAYVRIIVQLPTYPKQLFAGFQLVETLTQSVAATPVDGGAV